MFDFPVVDILSKFCCKVRLWWKWGGARGSNQCSAAMFSSNVQLHRAMRAQPFTDKLIRNICRSRFCIFVTQLCVYSLAWRRYVSVYLLLISSDSPKLARSIQTELMKQNVRKEKTIEWWMFSSSSHVNSNNRDMESFLKRKLKSQLHVVNCGRLGALDRDVVI